MTQPHSKCYFHSYCHLVFFIVSRKKMSSCRMKTQDSDEEVDLEALRLAALKSRKPKYPRINHSNLIPIVPVTVETPDFVNTKIKAEKVSPAREVNPQGENKTNKENEDEKASNYSELTLENDQDILSMDDKEEEDSLERLMDQLEAEISGKAPLPTNSSKSSPSDKKDKKSSRKNDRDGLDDEIELVQVKTGKEPNAIIEIRESASPERGIKHTDGRKSMSPKSIRSSGKRSRSKLRSRSRSPFLRERSYRRSRSPFWSRSPRRSRSPHWSRSSLRSRSPYWSRSPRRSRSPFRRSRSPYWASRRTRSKSRSPFRRYRSPVRKRSPFSCFSRSRSISVGRRTPWSLSPRKRSKSPFYYDGLPPRSRNFNSPDRFRRSFSPRKGSKSPRRRSRSPRRYRRNSPYHRSKSPLRRSRSPFKRASLRQSQSPFLHRSKSPHNKLSSVNRSPVEKRFSKSPHRSLPLSSEKLSPKPRSKSPIKRHENSRRSPGRLKDERSLSISTSPTPRRNRSPLKVVEKNKLDGGEKPEKPRDRYRSEKRHRSLSRENNRTSDRRPYRQRYLRRFSPSRNRKSAERQNRLSPKPKATTEKVKEEISKPNEKHSSPTPAVPLDPVLEARKKKFENLGEVDPTVDKKINLKAIKESTENPDEDEDALTINLESNLWDEFEESDDEFEGRFKSDGGRKNRAGANNRNILSFRNLREGDATSKKSSINKPLTDDHRRDRFRRDRHESWLQEKRDDRKRRTYESRSDEKESSKSKSRGSDKNSQNSTKSDRRSDRKPIIWSSRRSRKQESDARDNEVSTTQAEIGENKRKSSERTLGEVRNKISSDDSKVNETDDFEKLISDFEKELENDLLLTKEVNSSVPVDHEEAKRPKISVKNDLFEPKHEPQAKKPVPRIVKLSETPANKINKSSEIKNANKLLDVTEKVEVEESHQVDDGPEDYIEDDDFILEVSAGREQKAKGEEEDNQSDLRAVLSRRRNERLTKAVSLQENMPTRLVQSAFQGLGDKKTKRQIREVQDSSEFSSLDKTGAEGRRVLLLHREKNPLPSLKCTVPEVKPDTTILQRITRSNPRRKRKLQRQLDSVEDADQEEEEQKGFEVEEEKQYRRFRLKRNVTLSSQRTLTVNEKLFPSETHVSNESLGLKGILTYQMSLGNSNYNQSDDLGEF